MSAAGLAPDPVQPAGTALDSSSLPLAALSTETVAALAPPLSDNYDVSKELDKGSGGTVYTVRNRTDLKPYVVKLLHRDAKTDGRYLFDVYNEYMTMKRAYDPNRKKPCVVTAFSMVTGGALTDDAAPVEPKLGFVMEYVPYGDLLHVIMRARRLRLKIPERFVDRCFVRVLDAVKYLHNRSLVHRDVKPENVLVDAQGNLLLADFGYALDLDQIDAYPLDDGEFLFMGTPSFKAPELFKYRDAPPARDGHKVDFRAIDAWSLGILYYQLSVLSKPWLTADASDPSYTKFAKIYKQSELAKLDGYEMRRRLSKTEFAKFTEDGPLETLVRLLNPEPANRPNLKDEARSDWILQARAVPVEQEIVDLLSKAQIGS